MGLIHKSETSLDDLFSKFAIDPEEEIIVPQPEKDALFDENKKTISLEKNVSFFGYSTR